jgi:hypothetical protein
VEKAVIEAIGYVQKLNPLWDIEGNIRLFTIEGKILWENIIGRGCFYAHSSLFV